MWQCTRSLPFRESIDDGTAAANGCHRSLIADVLCMRGVEVLHVQDEKNIARHPYTAPARKYRGRLTYAPDLGEPLAERSRRAQLRQR
jgi:hypothetical protein